VERFVIMADALLRFCVFRVHAVYGAPGEASRQMLTGGVST